MKKKLGEGCARIGTFYKSIMLGLEHFISLRIGTFYKSIMLGLEHFISLSHPSPKLIFHFCPDASETFSLPFLLGFQ